MAPAAARLLALLAFVAAAAAPAPATAHAADELRGLWVVRTALVSPESVDRLVDDAVAGGFNALFVQVRGRGDAFYASRIVPRSVLLERQPRTFDPLARLLARARARGLQVHAWINVLLVAHFGQARPSGHVLDRHPDWIMVPKSQARVAFDATPKRRLRLVEAAGRREGDVEGYYLSPSVPEAVDHLERVVRELVAFYRVDGLHLDFVRYPGPQWDHSRAALVEFRQVHRTQALLGGPANEPVAWDAYRRRAVTALASRLSDAARVERPGIVLSAAVAGDEVQAINQKFQNWPVWLSSGILNAVCPMAYTADSQVFSRQVEGALARAGDQAVWAGIGAYRLDLAGIVEKVKLARRAGARGVVLFSHESLSSAEWPRLRLQAFPPPARSVASRPRRRSASRRKMRPPSRPVTRWWRLAGVALLGATLAGHAGLAVAVDTGSALPAASAEEAGFRPDKLAEADRIVQRAISDGAFPGAVLAVGRRGMLVRLRAFGRYTHDPSSPEVATDTVYDLASLTKVIATTTVAMTLVDQGRLDLEARVSGIVPGFQGGAKDDVRVRQLLTHTGGLLWWAPLYEELRGPEAYLERILEMPLDYEPGTKTIYSDLGLILLGNVLERLAGAPLDQIAHRRVFEPLGMSDTRYRPPVALRPRIAPTEIDSWRGRTLLGEVHDENAFALEGVAPHAGLFASAGDLARFAQMLLNRGELGGQRIVSARTVDAFTRRVGISESSRALGWDTPTDGSASRSSTPGEPGYSSSGSLFSARSFGHTGFTGTSMWMDPERDLFLILLTNRVHPTRDNRAILKVRGRLADAVIRALGS